MKSFEVNTWVWHFYPRRYVGKSYKWQRTYTGPYLITKLIGTSNAVLQKSCRSKPFVVHLDKLKLCLGVTPESWLTDPPSETVLVTRIKDANLNSTATDDEAPELHIRSIRAEPVSPVFTAVTELEPLPGKSPQWRGSRGLR